MGGIINANNISIASIITEKESMEKVLDDDQLLQDCLEAFKDALTDGDRANFIPTKEKFLKESIQLFCQNALKPDLEHMLLSEMYIYRIKAYLKKRCSAEETVKLLTAMDEKYLGIFEKIKKLIKSSIDEDQAPVINEMKEKFDGVISALGDSERTSENVENFLEKWNNIVSEKCAKRSDKIIKLSIEKIKKDFRININEDDIKNSTKIKEFCETQMTDFYFKKLKQGKISERGIQLINNMAENLIQRIDPVLRCDKENTPQQHKEMVIGLMDIFCAIVANKSLAPKESLPEYIARLNAFFSGRGVDAKIELKDKDGADLNGVKLKQEIGTLI